MKKVILILIVCGMSAFSVYSQPRSIGLRLGGNQEISFQQWLGNTNKFIQLDLGSFYFQGLQATCLLNWSSDDASNAFSVYGGIGATLGYNWSDNGWYTTVFWDKGDPKYKAKMSDPDRWTLRRYWFAGAVGQIAIEYKFPTVPLAVSLDWRPTIGFDFGKKWYTNRVASNQYSDKKGLSFHAPGIWDFGLSCRYLF